MKSPACLQSVIAPQKSDDDHTNVLQELFILTDLTVLEKFL